MADCSQRITTQQEGNTRPGESYRHRHESQPEQAPWAMGNLLWCALAVTVLGVGGLGCDNEVDAGENGPMKDGGGAASCENNQGCAEGQYCNTGQYGDYRCHDQNVQSCPAVPCDDTQVCMDGLCITSSSGQSCDGQVFGANDGCDAYSICMAPQTADGPGAPKCYTFPPCPQDGNCPVGASGSVCNEGYVPGKARICMAGSCINPSHCPAGWQCVTLVPGLDLGTCGSGRPGAPCTNPEHCVSRDCATLMFGAGICE